MRNIGTRAVAALVVGSAWCMPSHAGDIVARYRCVLSDGTVLSLSQDLTRDFRMSLGACQTVGVPANAVQPADVAGRRLDTERNAVSARPVMSVSAMPAGTGRAPAVAMPADLSSWLDKACRRYGVDHRIAAAVMYIESRFQSNARSPKGAMGLMQLMPATSVRYGVRSANDLLDPRVNIDVGVRHLRDLIERFSGRMDLVLAAYNAGEGAVVKHGYRIPPFAETEQYVQQVMSYVNSISLTM